jgi:hypothetical protein
MLGTCIEIMWEYYGSNKLLATYIEITLEYTNYGAARYQSRQLPKIVLHMCIHMKKSSEDKIRGRCYDHTYLRFSPIFGKKLAFFSKTIVMIQIFA